MKSIFIPVPLSITLNIPACPNAVTIAVLSRQYEGLGNASQNGSVTES
jgi:hypothetical protein